MEQTNNRRVYGISVANPVVVDKAYLKKTVDYAIENGINHIQIIGPIHDPVRGNLDGMTVYKKYAQFNEGRDTAFIKNTMEAFAEVLPRAREHGIKLYVWHHELELPDDFGKVFPETLNEYADFEVTHPIIKDFLEHKVYDFFEEYPTVDGIVLTLHETKVPLLKLKSQKLGRTERVKYVTEILYNACKKLGKELIVRPFASIPEDYKMLMQAYAEISTDLPVMDKWTQFDWSLCLPHNAFFREIKQNPLMVETDIFGEYFGKGRLPLMLLEHIKEKVEYCESFPILGYASRIDRNGMVPFDDVNEVNLDIMNATIHGESPEAAARAFFARRYPGVGDEVYDLMLPTEDILRRIIYLKGYYFSELSYFPTLNHCKNHFYFEMMKENFAIRSNEWFIPIGWERGPMAGVIAEKASAAAEARGLLEKLESLKDRFTAEDYAALLLKYRNLVLVAEVWQTLQETFLHYARYFETKDAAEEAALMTSLDKLASQNEAGEKLLGKRFYCLLGNEDSYVDFIGNFVRETRESFVAEKAEDEALRRANVLDYVICGGGSEGHKLMKEVNFSDTRFRGGEFCRFPGNAKGADWSRVNAHGWFSYELAVRPDADTTFEITLGSLSDKLALRVTLDGEETEIREPLPAGEQKTLCLTRKPDGKTAARIRIDRVSGDMPCVFRIVTK
ncbi:MAG: hypothetical protein MJ088_05065 [Clostridia bacterium]|nr:hypothetical protein [Clostridia bacterium]